MEMYTAAKGFVPNAHFVEQRRRALATLDMGIIDRPIVKLVQDFAQLPYCFTLQSCYGHFLYRGQLDDSDTEPLPESPVSGRIDYRIAYVALCLQDSIDGRVLYDDLSDLPSLDDAYVQFGCADWFWERQVNSYVLQVEPERFKSQDRAQLDYHEALHVEAVRNDFYHALGSVIERRARAARKR